MTIRAIQINENKNKQLAFKNSQVKTPYLEATGAINTANNVKPLHPQGYLVDDGFFSGVKYFFKDMAYDAKAVKNGILGKANDHQLGRLNDVGLKVGGIGIATYLASRTSNPKARMMEYLGLGTFLTAMNIYPKIAISGPAKLKHGFDVHKEYIDDQGRKKSVFQDSNYIPYDMYLGKFKDEDFDLIGDKLNIDRDAPNRKELVKARMRKIATQNNTMWMLTAGFATPAMTALLCCGLENYIVGPALETQRNKKYNKLIESMLTKTSNMDISKEGLKDLNSDLATKISEITAKYADKTIPKEEIKKIAKDISIVMDTHTGNTLNEEILRFIESNATKEFSLQADDIENIIKSISEVIDAEDIKKYGEIIPTKADFETILASLGDDFANGSTTVENLGKLKESLSNTLRSKIDNIVENATIPDKYKGNEAKANNYKARLRKHLEKIELKSLDAFEETLTKNKTIKLSKSNCETINNLAKIIGDFRSIGSEIEKGKSFKFEHIEETLLARHYSKFESVFIKELGITPEELRNARDSEAFAKKLLDKKFTELAKDETRYEKMFKNIGKTMSDMEIALHGKSESESYIQKLYNSVENLYNNTAKRLATLGGDFNGTAQALVREDLSTLGNEFRSRADIFDHLDGLEPYDLNKIYPKETDKGIDKEIIKTRSRGAGSAKRNKLARMTERYQGVRNSFNKLMLTMEFYKRASNPEEIKKLLINKSPENVEAVIELAKKTLLTGTSSDYALKLYTQNNPMLFIETVMAMFPDEKITDFRKIDDITNNELWEKRNNGDHEPLLEAFRKGRKDRGKVSETAKKALEDVNTMEKGNVLERYQCYITRFRRLIFNNANKPQTFMYGNHQISSNAHLFYRPDSMTPKAEFELISQNPISFIQNGSKNKYATPKWVKIIGGITAATFAVAILSQFFFGKAKKTDNSNGQVNNEQN